MLPKVMNADLFELAKLDALSEPMDRERMADYQAMVAELRQAGIRGQADFFCNQWHFNCQQNSDAGYCSTTGCGAY